jgi:hypothetical protein
VDIERQPVGAFVIAKSRPRAIGGRHSMIEQRSDPVLSTSTVVGICTRGTAR